MKRFEGVGVPAGRIRTVAEVCESEHLKARGMIVSLPHPKADRSSACSACRSVCTPRRARPTTPPPLLGQHTERVLRSVLGLGKAEVNRLRKAGAL